MARRSTQLALLVLALACAQPAGATHFRYGSFNYEPTEGVECGATFYFRAAFVRNYNWGTFWTGIRFETTADRYRTEPGGAWLGQDPSDSATADNPQVGWQIQFPSVEVPPEGICPSPFDYPDFSSQPDSASLEVTVGSDPPGCRTWIRTYGFFYGDGDTEDLVMDVEVVNDEETRLGNYIYGSGSFAHVYESCSADVLQSVPWLAKFIGGDRLRGPGQNDVQFLQNNYGGRFQLEMEVLLGDGNRSPVATQLPVLPIPKTFDPDDASLFTIAAFDPDVEDAASLSFRVGTAAEYGRIYRYSSRYDE